MTLKIKGTTLTNQEIELEQGTDNVCVYIDGCFVAIFRDDGTFTLHGQGGSNKYNGRWDDK